MGSGFQATEMWRDMVGILQTKVTVKNRRHLLKSYNGVFTGSNAVDVLFGQKQERPDLFTDNTTRENIVRLCQRFLETRVFFPAKQDIQQFKFEDSNTSFYRFNTDGTYLGAPETGRKPFQDVSNSNRGQQCQQLRASSEPDLTRVDCAMRSPDRPNQTYSPSNGITKHFSFMRKSRTRHLATRGQMFNGQVVENMHTSDDSEVFSDENIDNKVERECVRVRLLQMLDLSFIEGFVCSPSAVASSSSTSPTGRSNLIQSGAHLRQFHTHYQSSTDPWIKRAIDVFVFIPNGEQQLNHIRQFSTNRKKVLLFEAISNHYSKLSHSLISSQWDEVISAMQNLINDHRDSSEALQLFMRLLTPAEREEVHRLLSFLYIVRVSANVVLSDRYPNDTVIQMKFANLIFPVCGQMMLKVCLDSIDTAFSLPENIKRQIVTKVNLLRDGRIISPDAVPDSLFAEQFTKQEYQRQRTEGTNFEVLKQIQHVREMTNMSNERKEEIICSLQSQHPNAGVHLV